MTIVPIDRNTVKRNPNAFRQHYLLPGPMEIKGICYGELPVWLKDKVIETSWTAERNEIEFLWDGEIKPIHIEALKSIRSPKISIELKHNPVELHTIWPEPEYHYRYQNTPLQCNECGSFTGYKEIEEDVYIDSDGDEHNCDKCPICGGINSFEYKLEQL